MRVSSHDFLNIDFMNLFSFTVGTSYVIFEKQKDPFD